MIVSQERVFQMLINVLQTLFDYNTWANQRVFEEALHLSFQQVAPDEQGQFDALYETLFHLVNAQHLWLARCRETALPSEVKGNPPSGFLALHHYWKQVDQETHTFVRAVDTLDLQRIIHYVNPQGEANAYPLWQLLYHQVNHAAQHRSELAVSLTRFGRSPGWLDFLYYLDLRDGTTLHT
ncbi:MAG TPA: DinB family protein [Ktedonobacteraceae bacterium]|nr:DinB family protein [Ktedonobacteraceae bacterium]